MNENLRAASLVALLAVSALFLATASQAQLGPSPGVFTVKVTNSPGGGVLITSEGNPSGQCPSGAAACEFAVKAPSQVRAMPDPGYEFASWTGKTCKKVKAPACDFTAEGSVGVLFKKTKK